MRAVLPGGERSGTVTVPASKSVAHRLLICAALSEKPSAVICEGMSKDIRATVGCLAALGAEISRPDESTVSVIPITRGEKIFENTFSGAEKAGTVSGGVNIFENTEKPGNPAEAEKPGNPENPETSETVLPCGESGSTLRFLLPVAAALGKSAAFRMEGLLPERPHDALIRVLEDHGAKIVREGNFLKTKGKIVPGFYRVPGNISSQFVSGLLFALPLLEGESILDPEGELQSGEYIRMTEQALESAGIVFEKTGNRYRIPGGQRYRAPEISRAERDWSGAAFFLCMGAISRKGITVRGMNPASSQGDRKILEILRGFGAEISEQNGDITVKRGKLAGQTVDASEVPDLVPAVSALAAGAEGVTRIVRAERLRFKESDRLKTTAEMIRALGGSCEETADGLLITGKEFLTGGTVDPQNDHRIAMAAAVAAGYCRMPTEIPGAECAGKSYPDFWRDWNNLEG